MTGAPRGYVAVRVGEPFDVTAVESGGADFLLGDATTLAALAGVTERIGLVIDVDVSTAAPFVVARQLATLDHLSGGRAGALLAGGTDARTDEFGVVVDALWSSWAPDAVLADEAGGRYVDPARIRPVDHRGAHFDVRGVATLPAGPQGRPVLLRASDLAGALVPERVTERRVGPDFGGRTLRERLGL